MPDRQALTERLAEQLAVQGELHDPRWRQALHDFVHGDHEESSTRLDPRRLVADSDAADLAIAASVRGVQARLYYGDGDQADECTFWILDRSTREGSWASVDYVPGRSEFVVQQYGDRHPWDEVESAYMRWLSWGRPGLDPGHTVGGP